MPNPLRHVTRCIVAGFVALLPLLGMGLMLWLVESQLAASWLARQSFYVPGLGILLGLAMAYATGLLVTTFVGRWLWQRVDRVLERLPVVGLIYQSLKQVLGYDTARETFFQGVVLLPTTSGEELGLVTATTTGSDGRPALVVFVPGAPNPANGRLVLVPPERARSVDVKVAHALRALVALGKAPLR